MRPVIFRCSPWIFGLIVAGAFALLAVLPTADLEAWPPAVARVLVGAPIIMVGYALTLLPTRVVISDEGVVQKLLFFETRLRWEDMAEWRHCDGGEKFEQGELRVQSMNRWHFIEFWIKDKSGRKHYFKRWLVFGSRSKQFADVLRSRGIQGG